MNLCCDQRLKDDNILSAYSIQSASPIHALKRTVYEDQVQVKDPLNSISMQQVVTTYQLFVATLT